MLAIEIVLYEFYLMELTGVQKKAGDEGHSKNLFTL